MSESWAGAREAHRRAVREGIVTAALELLRERGATGVTMSELATRAGISRATLYAHFPDLEHVLLAWFTDEVERFMAELEARLAEHPDPLDRLRVYVLAQCEYFAAAQHRWGAGGLEAAGLAPAVGQAVDGLMGTIAGMVRTMLHEADERGLLRGGLDLDLTSHLVMALLGGPLLGELGRGSLDPQTAADAIMDLLLLGIQA